jgi:peroxiredoxin
MLRPSALALATTLLALGSAAHAAVSVGQPAPAFTATDTAGRSVSLADFKGKTVVLEWVNPGCPYVRKHYGSGNMPATQKDAVAGGVVWLSINSTAKDTSDYQPPAQLAQWMQSQKATPSATLMDESGRIGQAYGARTTPHMYVIDTNGVLAYAGAIDSKPTPNPADIAGATNYVKQALGELRAGKAVSQPVTRAYGCSVKYASGA